MIKPSLICAILALVCFLLAAVNYPSGGKVHLGWLGATLLVIGFLVS